MRFVGRAPDLERLRELLATVAERGTGTLVSVRGRRQVGKSRLLTEFLSREDVPHAYFTAIKNASTQQQMAALHTDVLASRHPIAGAAELFASPPVDWSDAFGKLALAARLADGPVVVVLDELPWAAETDPTLEGRLQNAWDRSLEATPVLLVLVGSDLAVMERLTAHDRPLYGRARELQVRAFDPVECQAALGPGCSALDAFDAHLVTGGYPRLVQELREAGSLDRFVREGLSDDSSALALLGQRSLDAEFAPHLQARSVLRAIGSQPVGRASFSNAVALLSSDTGPAPRTAIARGVEHLREKAAVAVDLPFGAPTRSKLTRYRVTDPYLSFWMRFVEAHLASIARGRTDLAIAAFTRDWTTWRGTAVEPIVREALLRLGGRHPDLSGVESVGGWWNRENNPEVDLVLGDRRGAVSYLGSVKWRARKAVTATELRDLSWARTTVPGSADARLVTVCPAGLARGVESDLHLGPDELLDAWRPGPP
ncbi:MAG: ATP-binding protein [Mycobacteriales bacterium]|nr:ATP-binding protein [Mycobacteriales bacterium]